MSSVISDKLDKFLKGNSLPKVHNKGIQLFHNKACKLESIQMEGDGEAKYQVKSESGPKLYQVDIKNWNGSIIRTKCNCEYDWGGICKHRVAALLSLKEYIKTNPTSSKVSTTAAKPKFITAQHILKIGSFDDWSLKQLVQEEDWKKRNDNLFQVNITHALNSVAEVDVSNKQETFHVKVERLRFNQEIFTSCSCHASIDAQLCVHKLQAILAIREKYGTYNPFDKMRDYTSEKNKLLQEYGFSLEDDLKGKFDFKINQDGSVALVKLDKSIQKISSYQNWRIINNKIFRPEEYAFQINTDETNLQETREIIYVVHFKDAKYLNDVQFEVHSCKINGQGKMSGFKSFDSAQFKDFPQLSDEDLQVIHTINSINADGIQSFAKRKEIRLNYFHDYLDREQVSADTLPIIEEYMSKQLDKVFHLLQGKNVFLASSPYFNSHHELTPITLSSERVIPFFTLRQDAEFIILEGYTRILKKRIRLASLINLNSFWIREYGEQLHKVASPEIANLLHYLDNQGVIKVKKEDFEGFVHDFIIPLSQKFDLEVNLQEHIQKEELQFIESKLMLKEEDNNLIFVPRFVYSQILPEEPVVEIVTPKRGSKKTIIPKKEPIQYEFAYDHKSSRLDYHNGDILIQERNAILEKEIFEKIQQLHGDFQSQGQYSFFHLSFNEVLKNDWLFHFFEEMKKENIKIFGTQELKKFKYNPNKASFFVKTSSGIDWFDMKIEVVFGDQTVSLKEIQKAVLKKQNYVELKDGTLGILPEEWLMKYEHIFKLGKIKGENLQVSKLHFSLLDELGSDIDNFAVQQELFEKKQKLLNFKQLPNVAVPHNVKATLRDYQLEGYKWLSFLDEFKWGGILADDMGLGKTLQMLTFLQEQQNRHKDTTNLVILPTTLIFNWQAEASKFCPDLKLFVHRGGTRQKNNHHWHEYDIILTTYGMVRSDIDLFKSFPFNYVVLDESQAIKNPDSLISKAVKQLNAQNRLVMTGTPVENNTFDLFSQMEFINPGLLGSQEFFKSEFATPIDKGQDKIQAAHLRKIVYPFVLKRTKEEVAKDLPEKTESIIFCEMDKKQRKVYDSYREEYRQKLVEKMSTDGKEKASFLILEGLLKLRQICDSPALINTEIPLENNSAKLDEIVREIEENAGNHKILIFSQFLKMLDLIREHLEKHHISYEYLDGKTQDREDRVNRFQEDENCRVFLMSLKAGGVGINLTEADYVYLIDPWWNPAVEQQAIDRTHRIGQKKNVFAYRMICKDTIEEKILLLQEKKKDLVKDLISTEEGFLKKLSQDDIIDLFS